MPLVHLPQINFSGPLAPQINFSGCLSLASRQKSLALSPASRRESLALSPASDDFLWPSLCLRRMSLAPSPLTLTSLALLRLRRMSLAHLQISFCSLTYLQQIRFCCSFTHPPRVHFRGSIHALATGSFLWQMVIGFSIPQMPASDSLLWPWGFTPPSL